MPRYVHFWANFKPPKENWITRRVMFQSLSNRLFGEKPNAKNEWLNDGTKNGGDERCNISSDLLSSWDIQRWQTYDQIMMFKPLTGTFGSNTTRSQRDESICSKRIPQLNYCCKEALALHDGASSWSPCCFWWGPWWKKDFRFHSSCCFKKQISKWHNDLIEGSRWSSINQEASLFPKLKSSEDLTLSELSTIFINQIWSTGNV